MEGYVYSVLPSLERESLFNLSISLLANNTKVLPRLHNHLIDSTSPRSLPQVSSFRVVLVQLHFCIFHLDQLFNLSNLLQCNHSNLHETHTLLPQINLDRIRLLRYFQHLKQVYNLSLLHEVLISLHLHHVDVKGDVHKHHDASLVCVLHNSLRFLLLSLSLAGVFPSFCLVSAHGGHGPFEVGF